VTSVLLGQSTTGESPAKKLRVIAPAAIQIQMHHDIPKETLLEVMSPTGDNRNVNVYAFIASVNTKDLGFALCNVEGGCSQKVESKGTDGWWCSNCETTSLSCSWQLRILVTCLHYSEFYFHPFVINVCSFSLA
jgi:hypothetical protein